MDTIMMKALAKTMAKQLGEQIIEQAPKYGAKFLLGVPCEVALYFASQAIIKEIQKKTQEKESEVMAEA